MAGTEESNESNDATVATMCLALLATMLVRAGEPGDGEIKVDFDPVTVVIGTDLVDRLLAMTAPKRSARLTPGLLSDHLGLLGIKGAVRRPGCFCYEFPSQGSTCACKVLIAAKAPLTEY